MRACCVHVPLLAFMIISLSPCMFVHKQSSVRVVRVARGLLAHPARRVGGLSVSLLLVSLCVADVGFMWDGKSAEAPDGNWTLPCSFEFDSAADGGKPIVYDQNLLAGDDGKGLEFVDFAAAEIEVWQL